MNGSVVFCGSRLIPGLCTAPFLQYTFPACGRSRDGLLPIDICRHPFAERTNGDHDIWRPDICRLYLVIYRSKHLHTGHLPIRSGHLPIQTSKHLHLQTFADPVIYQPGHLLTRTFADQDICRPLKCWYFYIKMKLQNHNIVNAKFFFPEEVLPPTQNLCRICL